MKSGNNSSSKLFGLLMAMILLVVSYWAPYWLLVVLAAFFTHQRFAYLENVHQALEVLDTDLYGHYLERIKRMMTVSAIFDALKSIFILIALYFLERKALSYLGFIPDRSNPLDPLTLLITTARYTVLWDQVRDLHWLFFIQNSLTLKVREPILVRLARWLFLRARRGRKVC